MQIISNIALITINETLIVQVISFLIFLFIINRIMFRPLNRVMRERNNYMERLKEEVRFAETEMFRITQQLEKLEADAKNEAFQLRKEVEKSGDQRAAEIFAATRHEIMELKSKTAANVQKQIKNARASFQAEAKILSTAIMENVLNRRLSS